MKTYTIPLTLLALGVLLLAGVLLLKPTDSAFGGAFTGQSAFLQLSTTTTLGPGTTTALFAENQNCKSRVITTRGTSAVMIAFDDIPAAGNVGSTSVSGTIGHLQLASTTVAYDGELYGCSKWYGWGFASSTITVSEF
jgi:hypothetical protein